MPKTLLMRKVVGVVRPSCDGLREDAGKGLSKTAAAEAVSNDKNTIRNICITVVDVHGCGALVAALCFLCLPSATADCHLMMKSIADRD